MTVTALPTRPAPAEPESQRTWSRHPSAGATATPPEETLTVSVTVTLAGEDRYDDAAQVLQTLRAVTSRLAGAHLHVAPALATSSTVEETADLPREPDAAPATEPVLIFAGSRDVRLHGRSIPFTRIEFDLLHFLAEHPGQVFTREQLLHRVWGAARGGLRTVDVHIRRLRAKLDDREVATTVRGVGYRLADGANLRVVAPGSLPRS